MGWVESPPYSSAVIETIADLTNKRINRKYSPPHQLEKESETPTPTEKPANLYEQLPPNLQLPNAIPITQPLDAPSNMTSQQPPAKTEVYVDDFCNMMQGNCRWRRIAKRILFHTINEVLTPLEPEYSTLHKEPISIKKLLQGDGHWELKKIILGWLLDTLNCTVKLPTHRYERL